MANLVTQGETNDKAHQALCQLGFWAAALTALFAVVALAIGFATPPLSGPGCVSGCISYPYAAVAFLVPHDYIWMYPAIFLALLFVVLMVCLHQYAAPDRKLYSQIGLTFAVIYATVISIDYFIQLSVMQPSLLKGETEGLVFFSMYNPHGAFIALEDLGYLAMSVAFFFVSWVLAGSTRLERGLRWLLRAAAAATVASFVGMSLIYGPDLEYRFELAAISINWLALIVGGVLLGVFFRRATRLGPVK